MSKTVVIIAGKYEGLFTKKMKMSHQTGQLISVCLVREGFVFLVMNMGGVRRITGTYVSAWSVWVKRKMTYM